MKGYRLTTIVAMTTAALFAMTPTAFAAHEWLNLNGEKPVRAENALIDGTIISHNKIPTLFGGGTILWSCTGQYHGTVNASGKGEIASVLGLGAENKVHCEVLSSTNTLCGVNELVTISFVHLSWKTLLVLVEENTEDELLAGNSGSPGWETTCKGVTIKCETAKENAKFIGNAVSGAELEFTGKTITCSNGATSALLGKGVVLDWFVS